MTIFMKKNKFSSPKLIGNEGNKKSDSTMLNNTDLLLEENKIQRLFFTGKITIEEYLKKKKHFLKAAKRKILI